MVAKTWEKKLEISSKELIFSILIFRFKCFGETLVKIHSLLDFIASSFNKYFFHVYHVGNIAIQLSRGGQLLSVRQEQVVIVRAGRVGSQWVLQPQALPSALDTLDHSLGQLTKQTIIGLSGQVWGYSSTIQSWNSIQLQTQCALQLSSQEIQYDLSDEVKIKDYRIVFIFCSVMNIIFISIFRNPPMIKAGLHESLG